MDVSLRECRKAAKDVGWTGVHRIFLCEDATLVVLGDGARGNGTEKGSIRLDAADFEEMGQREQAREIQRRFSELD